MSLKSTFVLSAAAIAAGTVIYSLVTDPGDHAHAPGDGAAVSGPELPGDLSGPAARGRLAFNNACATCHGRDALGGDGGPPLIHKIYEPSHHADITFHRAVQYGVQAHHWGFGDMPPQPGVAPADVERIIVFVREVQRANGIL